MKFFPYFEFYYSREEVEDEDGPPSKKSQKLLNFMKPEKKVVKPKDHTFFTVRNLHQTVKL